MNKFNLPAQLAVLMLAGAQTPEEALEVLETAFETIYMRGKYDTLKNVSSAAAESVALLKQEARANAEQPGEVDVVGAAIIFGKAEAYTAISNATGEVADAIEAEVTAPHASDEDFDNQASTQASAQGVEDAFEGQPRINAQVDGFKYEDLNLVNVGPEAAR